MTEPQKKYVRTRATFDRVSVVMLGVFVVIAIVLAVLSFGWVRGLVATWSMTPLEGVPVDDGSSVKTTGTPQANAPSSAQLPAAQASAAPAWDGVNRVTMLIMGLDYRDWVGGDIPRTDTMMLITMDPVNNTAAMLSIPRDMWVAIPGFDHNKINTAYFLGESFKIPGGGPGLAVSTVEQFLGVPINYYAQIDFNAFVDFIDEINGVKLDVTEEIIIDPIGADNKVFLKPGRQTLNGAIALAYARTRKTEGGDFDRARRQQQVVMALRDKILSVNMMPTLVAKAPVLYKKLSAGIRTNLTLDQAIQLAYAAQKIPAENIQKGVIGTTMINFGTSPDGLAILRPLPDRIREERDRLFTTAGAVAPLATGEPVVKAKAEKARISVQNGSSRANLLTDSANYLKSLELNVAEERVASARTAATTIIDYTGKPYTTTFLIQQFGIRADMVLNKFDPTSKIDVAIILGDDLKAAPK